MPFLLRVFKPLVTAIFGALAAHIDENDQQASREKQLLHRSYFLFIAAIVTNGVTEVISAQGINIIVRKFVCFHCDDCQSYSCIVYNFAVI